MSSVRLLCIRKIEEMKMKIFSALLLVWIMNIGLTKAQTGKIVGTVYDENGETMPGVLVYLGEMKTGKQTDIDGKFTMQLTPGTYSLRFEFISYKKQRINNVVVKENEITDLAINMAPQDDSVLTAVDVVVHVPRDNDAGMDYARKKSGNAQDGVNAANLRRTPASTASDAIKKITGATIQDNKFAIIRGMSDRYNAAYINGSPLPSSESDRRAISFDIFPSNLLDNIIILKTGTPDVPGEFAGGVIQINTKSIPEETSHSVSLSTGYNSITTFKDFKTYEGSKTDWLGIDNGARALPEGIPGTEDLRGANVLERGEYAKQFAGDWSLINKKGSPNISGQYVFGLSDSLGKNPAGLIFAMNYGNNNATTIIERNQYEEQATGVVKTDSLNDANYTNNIVSSVLLNAGIKLGNHTSIKFNNLYSINTEDRVVVRSGARDMLSDQYQWEKGSLRSFTQNTMYSGQLGSEHQIKRLKFEWSGGYSNVIRDIPNMRRMVYRKTSDLEGDSIPYAAVIDPNNSRSGGILFFATMNEKIYSGKYDFTLPFEFKKTPKFSFDVKAGGLHQFRDRTFTARNIGFEKYKVGTSIKFDSDLLYLDEGQIFNSNYIGQMTDSAGPYNGGFSIKETTRSNDSYLASATLHAGYGMVDLKFGKHVRLITGARYENYNQYFETSENGKPIVLDTTVTDVLPSANLVLSFENEKTKRTFVTRMAYFRTVSRPEFRELANFSFYDFILDYEIYGSNDLKRAVIDNYDLRLEYYPMPGQLISLSGFYKNITNPTELASRPDVIRTLYYTNVDKAINYGAELEYRIKLGMFTKVDTSKFVSQTSFFANFTYIKSEVQIGDLRGSTSETRPLQGQSPYVINAGITTLIPIIDVNVTLSYNIYGRRIFIVGSETEPDFWENPRSVIDCQLAKDFGKHWNLRFNMRDLLAQKINFYQDIDMDGKYDEFKDNTMISTQVGRVFQFNLSYKF